MDAVIEDWRNRITEMTKRFLDEPTDENMRILTSMLRAYNVRHGPPRQEPKSANDPF